MLTRHQAGLDLADAGLAAKDALDAGLLQTRRLKQQATIAALAECWICLVFHPRNLLASRNSLSTSPTPGHGGFAAAATFLPKTASMARFVAA
jgi:hypothetical protein